MDSITSESMPEPRYGTGIQELPSVLVDLWKAFNNRDIFRFKIALSYWLPLIDIYDDKLYGSEFLKPVGNIRVDYNPKSWSSENVRAQVAQRFAKAYISHMDCVKSDSHPNGYDIEAKKQLVVETLLKSWVPNDCWEQYWGYILPGTAYEPHAFQKALHDIKNRYGVVRSWLNAL